jgi:aminopeptidase N
MIAADSLSAAEARLLEDALAHDFWAIRQTALNLLQDQPGVWSADVLQKAEEMARDDQRSLVRADALSLLAAADAEAYRAFFRDAMQDSSYAVVGSAVAAYSLTEAGDKAALYEPLQEYDNFNVVIALADYFVEEAVTGKYGWFSRKMEQVGDEALYYLLNYFARYLMTAEEQVQDKGIALLADYAEFHPRYYIRLNAYRSLGFFAEKEEVQQMRSAIRQAENDPRLQELYRESVW